MHIGSEALGWLLQPVRKRLAQVNLKDHEDTILTLLALVISAIVGLVVVTFVAMTERMGKVLLTANSVQRLASPLLGSLIGGWLLFRFFPEARGSGIPQTRIALVLHKGVIGIRTVLGKFLCSSISLGSGVALGREGPSVQIGAGIASTVGRRLGLSSEHVRSLIPVGTAAAVAAAFNTPLAAVLFTLEEILADLHARVVGSVVIGAATSWMVLRLILGDEPLFHVPAYQLVHPIEFVVYAVLGVCGGLVSTAFVKLLLWQRTAFQKTPVRWKPFTPAVGGLLVGLLALAAPGVLGVGYHLVSQALNGQMVWKMMLLLLALKLVATATCYSSGNAGGIFGPSLFIGAMLGGVVGQAAHALLPDYTGNAGAYALVGMGAAFAGIVRTPMTSVIMIFEVTRDYTIIVPLMIANMCSYVLAQRLQKLPIYEALSRQDGVEMPSAAHRPEPLVVERAMRRLDEEDVAVAASSPYVHPDDPLDTALQRMGAIGIEEISVASRAGGRRIGLLSRANAFAAYQNRADSAEEDEARSLRNWLPAVAAITVATILITSGLVIWQRGRRAALGQEAYLSGRQALSEGRTEEAVSAFRTALAHQPQNPAARTALGLALVRLGNMNEAKGYLKEAIRQTPENGQAWVGLARVARAENRLPEARQAYRQALAQDWVVADEPLRQNAEFEYAAVLADAGQRNEAVSQLLALIEQNGDEPAVGKRAAALIQAIGSAGQAEEAWLSVASRFPADPAVWIKLGDLRLGADKEKLALDAYRRALKAEPDNPEAGRAVARTEEVLRLDPTRRGLSVRERAGRWDEVLARVVAGASECGSTPELERARRLLTKRSVSLAVSDQKMENALKVWQSTSEQCKSDAVLGHILRKLGE
jgi:CIC family chloride channel protein